MGYVSVSDLENSRRYREVRVNWKWGVKDFATGDMIVPPSTDRYHAELDAARLNIAHSNRSRL